MGKITVETCEIEGLKIITPTVFDDARGYFMETYNYNDFKAAGIPEVFVQDNQSASKKGVLRGLHFQKHFPQDKLVRVIRGEVYDVAVDLREGSKTFGQWYGVLLSEENKKQFFIPKNFAHGFLVLSDYAEFCYKCTDFYHPDDEGGIAYNTPDIGVEWPIPEGMELTLSEKDTKWGTLEQYMKEKGIREPFRFMIYSSYHRSFPGFWQYEDYRKSHSYLMTLEDPQTFVGVFDFVAPMVYMDVYANYEDYDMLLPWRDTAVLRRITGDKVPIAPILCAGYPFTYAFGSDLNAEMLKYNMLEVIAGGGKGFGFWGECPFDAADMKAVAEVVGMLAPYEKIILEGKAEGKVTVCSGNAVAKRVTSPAGSLLLVSEYSRRPLKVELECPVTERSRVIDLSTGRQIAEITETEPRFTLNLGKDRAVMLYIGR